MSILNFFTRKGLRFLTNTSGNVALLFGLAAVPIVLALGVAVDYSLSSQKKIQLQAAADAAALSAAALDTTDDNARITAAQDFFRQNYPNLQGVPNVQILNGRVVVDVSQMVPTAFMTLVGFSEIETTSHAEAIISLTQPLTSDKTALTDQ